MKTNVLMLMAILTVSTTIAQTETKLNGKVTNPTGEKVYMYQMVEGENGRYHEIFLDSFELKADGVFEMATKLEITTQVSFYDGTESCPVILTPGDDLYLTLNTTMFDETILYTGKGAAKNNAVKNVSLIKEVILNKVYSYTDETDTAVIFKYMSESFAQMETVVKDYQSEIPDFKDYGDEQLTFIEKAGTQIKKNLVADRAFDEMVQQLIGTDAINIEGVTLKGKKVTLDAYKGKTIIIDFWATWCGPCKAEMPAFKELEEKYGNDVNFVSLGIYCKEDAWKEMAADLGFKNNMYVSKETQGQVKPWDVKYIPRYVVIGSDFKVIDALAPRPSSGDLEALILMLNPNLK